MTLAKIRERDRDRTTAATRGGAEAFNRDHLMLKWRLLADVAELADARDSKSRIFGFVGSIPTIGMTGQRRIEGSARPCLSTITAAIAQHHDRTQHRPE
jgi:hypothetical protein